MGVVNLHLGDCLEVMATLPDESVDAVVTDPPYGLEFMGKEWDALSPKGRGARVREKRAAEITPDGHGHTTSKGPYLAAGVDWQGARQPQMQQWHEAWAREAFRLLKPGGYLLAFGGTRTYHRLACAIEDAGFEIRDCLVWGYASGFPKSRSLRDIGRPELGSALKPAWEPIVMARKPLRGTLASTVLAYGTGALNIDGTRIGTGGDKDDERWYAWERGGSILEEAKGMNTPGRIAPRPEAPVGRWPANIVLTDPIFDGGVDGVVGGGETSTSNDPARFQSTSGGAFSSDYGNQMAISGDTGTYSRFFLVPKEARSGREPLIAGQLVERNPGVLHGSQDGSLNKRTHGLPPAARANTHPTVKPLELMRHLVRLVTPPGGTCLDPFLGSGTTAIACEMEGFQWIGIEKEPEYVEIAKARLNGVQRGLGLDMGAAL